MNGKSNGRSGLVNLGNTCYMNTILQCLSNTTDLHDYIVNEEYDNDYNEHSPVCELTTKYRQLLLVMWEEDSIIQPQSFKQTLGEIFPKFLGTRQHDAHELLVMLLDAFHDTLRCDAEVDIEGNPETEKDYMMLTAYKKWKEYLEKEKYSIIIELFSGQLCSTIKSKETDHISYQYDPFTYLTLEIPYQGVNNLLLYDCLNTFTGHEVLDDDNKYKIDEIDRYVRAEKQITIWNPPKYLIIHLKRFIYNIKLRAKITTLVQFPINGLDITRYITGNNNQRHIYNLYAVVNHSGGMNGGHYYAYCKNGGSWYNFNDSQIQQINENQLVTNNAYILFYKKV